LDLLECKAQGSAELFLRHSPQHTTQAEAVTDLGIDRTGFFTRHESPSTGNHVLARHHRFVVQ
jgi:hypothetical protein